MPRHKRHARLQRALPAPASTEDRQDGGRYAQPLRNLICNAAYGSADYTLVFYSTRLGIFIQRLRVHRRSATICSGHRVANATALFRKVSWWL